MNAETIDKSKVIRHAATVVLIRDADTKPRVLMGQRGAKAAFMPNKFVFPGGAVDKTDHGLPVAEQGAEPCRTRLGEDAPDGIGPALLAAAIRELWEETGQILGTPGTWPSPPPDNWRAFAESGYIPSPDGLAFVFRAITPPGRPRRFDARFFVADAARLKTDPDDFSGAADELSHLQWISLADVRDFDLPFITQVVLAEIAGRLPDLDAPPSVPYFKNDEEESLFLRLQGASPLG
ncbi:NUDIX hydrolase [Maritimibacter sp. UBA3975]|uniref:NUDIX hydrolase n=1 Tax=Maritimibacter sp. UBA3975 TaxID=1946833 RepID=UPI000C0A436C|nr:NUDIX hydrolase [Maritimibacter sp. UBA3975]MAM62841.1 DNA mismatch repair protein MutT [Maritimibacter sp.]|tara:strand:- start:1365 stop:2072 length:708 start_codon:yes stop_codon:yes gene_type:complete